MKLLKPGPSVFRVGRTSLGYDYSQESRKRLKYWGFLGALAALVGSACGGATGADASPLSKASTSSEDGGVGGADAASTVDGSAGAPTPIEACDGDVAPLGSDPFDINRFAIDQDIMTIDVRGGCSAEEFTLCYVKHFGMSDPPSAGVYVLHNATRICDPPPDLTLVFDLRPLANYFSPQGDVLLVTVWNRDESGKAIAHGPERYEWGDPSSRP
jgi:hypothetical protein